MIEQVNYYRFAGDGDVTPSEGLVGVSLVLEESGDGRYKISFPEEYTRAVTQERRPKVWIFPTLLIAKAEFAKIKLDILGFGYEITP